MVDIGYYQRHKRYPPTNYEAGEIIRRRKKALSKKTSLKPPRLLPQGKVRDYRDPAVCRSIEEKRARTAKEFEATMGKLRRLYLLYQRIHTTRVQKRIITLQNAAVKELCRLNVASRDLRY